MKRRMFKLGITTFFLFILSSVLINQTTAEAREFTDVPKNHPNYAIIQDMQKQGYVSGYPDGTFRPNERISRKHVASLLDKALKLPEPTATKAKYKDVPVNHPYYASIMKLTAAGIVSGGPDGKFNPEAPMTRVQIAKVLDLAFKLNMTSQFAFRDVHVTHWGYPHVNALYANGVAKGDNYQFKPNTPVTRAHYAVFLHRAIEAGKQNPQTEQMTKNDVWDLANRLPWNIEQILLEGKMKKQPFSAIRSKFLPYATEAFIDRNLREYYPYACTECDVWYFPALTVEPNIRFDFTQPSKNVIALQTIEFDSGITAGGFVDYRFENVGGTWKVADYRFKVVGNQHFHLTVDEAKKVLQSYYTESNNEHFRAIHLYTTTEQGRDYNTNSYYNYDQYVFLITTKDDSFTVFFDSNDGMFDQVY